MISASSRKMRDGRAKPDFLQSGLADHLANWFIPTSMRLDPDARRRALLFLISHLLGPWLGLAIVGYLYWLDSRPAPLLLPAIAIAAFWLFPLALRLSGRFALLALLSVQNLAFVVLFISYHYGGLSSPFLPWLVTIPMLAFFYLGDDKRMRCIALIGLVADLAVFYLAYRINGSFPNRLPLQSLSSVGLVSVFCAGLYVTIMASYYGRIVVSRSELQREILRHKQTAIMLVEARDTAEDANRAKSSFLANMSHELRTPLNAVIGFSEIMRNELFGSLGHQNYKDYANDIHASGSHLLQVINDILDISKADSGTLELRECVINCRDLLAECRRYVRPRLRKAELTLTSNLPNSLPRLRADPRMVKQIVLNLLTNAVKFTQPGGHIEIEASADRYRGFTITIRDTGIGITKTDLGRVREPFVQVDNSLSRRQDGTGLGLSLVEMMMRQHGGVLEIDSQDGSGTSARVRFPVERVVWLHECSGDTEISDMPSRALEKAASPSINPVRTAGRPLVLVVEDDRELRELLRRMLEHSGFATVAASNGRKALHYLSAEPVALLITDMVMPDMDGIELLRVLQTERPELPVIALSGVENFNEYHRIAMHLGARAALRKPVTRADLTSAVNKVLGLPLADSYAEHEPSPA